MSDSENIKILSTVASGGTAVLFKALQTSLDRIVAVKRLHSHLTSDENFTRRFILEAKAAASLEHENIVHVIDFGRVGDDYQMILEFVEGQSLADILERWRPIQPELALAIVHQICMGLEHAHSKGIVHRDIKPGNVMITNYGRIKITDFGLAKLTQATTSHTADDSILGTPLYMSPEQAFGESVDHRSDLFSLGTVLYELVTGKQPFASENYMGVIQNIINKNITPVSEVNPRIPSEIVAIVNKALSKNRDDRFQSAREFRERIEDYLGLSRLNELGDNLRVLLDTNANTQVLSKSDLPESESLKKRKTSPGAVVALALLLFIAAGTGAVMFKPELLESVRAYIPIDTGPPQTTLPPQAASSAGITVDMGLDDLIAATDSTAAAESVATDPEAAVSSQSVDATPVTATPQQTTTAVAEKTPPREDKPKPRPAKPRVREGWLVVEANVSAEVYVDGVYRGDTPMTLKLTAGQHKIECRSPRHQSYSESLRIIAGEQSMRTVTLQKLSGRIVITTNPGAQIFVDGKLKGVTPMSTPLIVDAGTHTVTLRKTGFHDWSSTVEVGPNGSLPLNITLSKKF